MRTCKNCTYWDRYDTACALATWFDIEERDRHNLRDGFGFVVDADDDQGLNGAFVCGPDFGCVHFERREK